MGVMGAAWMWRAAGKPWEGHQAMDPTASSLFFTLLAITFAFCRCICYFTRTFSPVTQNAQFLRNIQVKTSVQTHPTRKGRTLFFLL